MKGRRTAELVNGLVDGGKGKVALGWECWITTEHSFLIGDKQSDIDAGTAAGIHGFLFKGGDLLSLMESVLPRWWPADDAAALWLRRK